MSQGQLKEAFYEYSMANHPFAHQRVIELAVNLKSELPRLSQYLRQLSSVIDPHLLYQGQYLSWQLKFDGEVFFKDDQPNRTPQLLALIDWMKVCVGSLDLPFRDDYFDRACFEILLVEWFDLISQELQFHQAKDFLPTLLDHFYDQALLGLIVNVDIFEKLFQYEIRSNRLEKAVFVLEQQIEMAKLLGNIVQASLVYIKIGELYRESEIEKANDYYDLSLKVNPNQFLAHQAKAVLFEERGEKETAILYYQNALKGMQDLPHNQSFKAEIEKKIKDLERSIFIEREFASLERFESEQLAKAVSFEEVSQHLKQTLFHDQEQLMKQQEEALKEAQHKEALEKEEKKKIIQAKLKALQEQWHDDQDDHQSEKANDHLKDDELDLHQALSQTLQHDDSIEGLDHLEQLEQLEQIEQIEQIEQLEFKFSDDLQSPQISPQQNQHIQALEQKAAQAVNRIQKYKTLFELAEYLRDEVMDFKRSEQIFLEIVANGPINQYEMLEASVDDLIETFTSQQDYEALRDLYDLLIKRGFDNLPFLYLQKAVYHYQLGEYHSTLIAIENSKLKLKDYQKQKSEYLKQKSKLEGSLDLEIKTLKQLGREDELIDLLTQSDDLSEEEIQYRQLLLARHIKHKEPTQALQLYADLYPHIEEQSLKDVVFDEWFNLSELVGDPVEKSKLLDQQSQKIEKEIQLLKRELEGLDGKPAQKLKLDLQKLIRKQSKLYSNLAMDLEDQMPILAIDLYFKAYQIWQEDFDSAEKVCTLARQEKKYQILMEILRSLITVALDGEDKAIYLIYLAGVYLILGNFNQAQTYLKEADTQFISGIEDRSRLIDVLDWIRSTVSENHGQMDQVNVLLKDLEFRLAQGR
jgi:tetratricopeptide (TPR) repeat protein